MPSPVRLQTAGVVGTGRVHAAWRTRCRARGAQGVRWRHRWWHRGRWANYGQQPFHTTHAPPDATTARQRHNIPVATLCSCMPRRAARATHKCARALLAAPRTLVHRYRHSSAPPMMRVFRAGFLAPKDRSNIIKTNTTFNIKTCAWGLFAYPRGGVVIDLRGCKREWERTGKNWDAAALVQPG